MSVRDMYNQAFDKVNGGDAFGYSFMVFMALIVEGYRSPIIGINPGSGNDGPAQISADIFNSDIRGARIGFGPDIKPIEAPKNQIRKAAPGFRTQWGGGIGTRMGLIPNPAGSSFPIMV